MEWRYAMRWKIAGLLCGKFVLLTLLWALFFSPSHRSAVDSAATSDRLGVSVGPARGSSGRIPTVMPTQPENTRE